MASFPSVTNPDVEFGPGVAAAFPSGGGFVADPPLACPINVDAIGPVLPLLTQGCDVLGPVHSAMIEGRMIISPVDISVGLVVEDIQQDVLIWNNFQASDAVLNVITPTNGEGITISGMMVGTIIGATRDLTFSYVISPAGPLVIDARFDFTFSLQALHNTIDGFRGLSKIFEPLQNNYSQGYLFQTDIYRAQDGTENRCSLFGANNPVRTVTMDLKPFNQRELSEIQDVLTFGEKFLLFIPLWLNEMKLTTATDGIDVEIDLDGDPADFEFEVDTQVLLYRNPLRSNNCGVARLFEIRKVVTVNATSLELDRPASVGFGIGDLVLPLIQATPQKSVNSVLINERRGIYRISFQEVI